MKKIIFLTGIFVAVFTFCLLAQGPPPPPSQGGGGPAGVPLDGASGMIVLGALGALYKKYYHKKSTSEDSTPSNPAS